MLFYAGNLPAGFSYPAATNEEKDNFLRLLGQLVGQELLLNTLTATEEIEETIRAAKAQVLRPAIDQIREQTKARIQARDFLASQDEAALHREMKKLTADAESMARKLAEAVSGHDAIVAKKKGCSRLLEQLAAAKATMTSGDVTVLAACEVIEQHEKPHQDAQA